jgi:hypothetical protein
LRASVVYDRRAQVRTFEAVRLGRSPSLRTFFVRGQRGESQRKKIVLVATAHYLLHVMWAMMKRGTVWEEKLALAKEPNSA